MALQTEQIETNFGVREAGARKWMRNQRNRKIRRVPKDEFPNIKYNGWGF